jgi:hypothetical protein
VAFRTAGEKGVNAPGHQEWERKNPMNMPQEVKPALWGAAGGAIVWWVVLAFGFGWTSAGTTEKLASGRAEKAVITALAPICAEKFNAQADVAAKRVTLNDTSSWQRRDLFPKEWVTLPGGSYPSSDLVEVCSDLILKPKTALK